jgi:hypothetical protein
MLALRLLAEGPTGPDTCAGWRTNLICDGLKNWRTSERFRQENPIA